MDSKVLVTADKSGNVIVVSGNNPEFGHIRVEQVRMEVDDSTGFAKMKKISALIPGTVIDLKGFGWSNGQEVAGKIRIVEKLEPFNKKDPERDYKIAGKSEIVCCQDGQPIYRKHFFTLNSELEDVREPHTNDAEISAFYSNAKQEAIEPNKEFDL